MITADRAARERPAQDSAGLSYANNYTFPKVQNIWRSLRSTSGLTKSHYPSTGASRVPETEHRITTAPERSSPRRSMAPAAARLLLVVLAVTSSLAVGADVLRSLGVGDGAGATAQGDYAVELDGTTFDAFLTASRESFAFVEFYAHWCPACWNYKPHYEKVAKLFNGPDAAHPGRILMARIDCASKVNIDLCRRFSVDHYPFLLWGPPPKFANIKWDRKQEKSEIKLIDDGRTAERLLKWINKQMESSFTLDDKKYENENMLPTNVSYPKQVVQAIYNVAEATTHALQIFLEHNALVQ